MATKAVKTRKAKAVRKGARVKTARTTARPRSGSRVRPIAKREFNGFRRLLEEERARLQAELEAME
ncbi:MAG: hypothetical protein ACRDFT_03570, partial [bacterium]